MLLENINPFIRYASISTFSYINNYVYTYDCRLFYILEGKGEINFENEKYTIESGTLLLWRSGTKYYFKIKSKIKMIILNFDYTQLNNNITKCISPILSKLYNKNKVLEQIEFSDCEVLNRPIVLKNIPSIEKDLIQIVNEFDNKRICFKEKSSGLLKKSISEIVRSTFYASGKAFDKIDIIMEYIKNNFKEDIDNKKLGNIVGYHSYYINRLMQMHTGTTLRQYLLNYRIENAKKLLLGTDIPISIVSEECGFKALSYFSNCFKSKTGLSPLQYRTVRKNLI